MAKKVVKTGYFAAGSGPTDYSAQVAGFTVDEEADEVETTTLGSSGFKEFLQGLRSGSITVEPKFDADLSGFFSAIRTVYRHATDNTWAVRVRSSSDAASASNPEYRFTVLISKAPSFSAKLGETFGESLTWKIITAPTEHTS